MKKFFGILCCMFFGIVQSSNAQIVDPLPYVPIQYVVTTSNVATKSVFVAQLEKWNMDHKNVYGSTWRVWFPIWTQGEWADSLSNLPYVNNVTIDQFRPAPPPEPNPIMPMASQWNMAMMHVDSVHARGIDGAGQTIMILDSGIDTDHPLLPNVIGGYDFTGNSSNPSDPSAWNDDIALCKGHGTHVAGTAAGQGGYGVAPGAKLFAAKVFEVIDNYCGSWVSSQIAAINMMGDSGWIGNASIGGSYYGAQDAALWAASNKGGWLAAAAGNDASKLQCPGCYAYAFGVAAVTSSGARASYSGQGAGVDIAAPGSGIVSTMPDGGTGTKSGTSMASPHIAGELALLRQRRPNLTLAEAMVVLSRSSVDKGAPDRDPQYGWGVVDALAADDYLLSHPTIPEATVRFSTDTLTISRTGSVDRYGWRVDSTSMQVFPETDLWHLVTTTYPPTQPGDKTATLGVYPTMGSQGKFKLVVRVWPSWNGSRLTGVPVVGSTY